MTVPDGVRWRMGDTSITCDPPFMVRVETSEQPGAAKKLPRVPQAAQVHKTPLHVVKSLHLADTRVRFPTVPSAELRWYSFPGDGVA